MCVCFFSGHWCEASPKGDTTFGKNCLNNRTQNSSEVTGRAEPEKTTIFYVSSNKKGKDLTQLKIMGCQLWHAGVTVESLTMPWNFVIHCLTSLWTENHNKSTDLSAREVDSSRHVGVCVFNDRALKLQVNSGTLKRRAVPLLLSWHAHVQVQSAQV